MGDIFVNPTVVITVLTAIKFTLKIIVTRRAFFITSGRTSKFNHFLNPPLLSICRGVDRLNTMFTRIVQACGDMFALPFQHIGEIKLERRLIAGHYKKVGEVVAVNAQQGANAIFVLFR